MNIWLRRLLMLLFVLFWLALIMTPTLAFVLARNGQVQLGRPEGRHWRLFLMQEADIEGVGLERGRPVAPPTDAPESVSCLKTTVSYWLWTAGASDDGQGASYCQCTDESTGALADVLPPACMTIE